MSFQRRPVRLSAALSLAAGVVALTVISSSGGQHRALAVAVGGLALLAVGTYLWNEGHRGVGALAGVGGLLVSLAAVGLGAVLPPTTSQRIELIPGLLGLPVLALAFVPVRVGWERRFLTAGTALLFLSVLASGVVSPIETLDLLLAAVAVVAAWDVGEQGIALGRQVGVRARTRRAELVHGGAALAVGGVGILVALGFQRVGVEGVPLAGLAVLLAAAVALTVALSQ